jgi:hypothetical protein
VLASPSKYVILLMGRRDNSGDEARSKRLKVGNSSVTGLIAIVRLHVADYQQSAAYQ